MQLLYYFVPGYYTWRTRIRPEGIGALMFHSYGYIVSCFPVLLQAILKDDALSALRDLLLGFILLYTLYEVLYVFNDFVAIKYETLPTYRAQGLDINFIYFALIRSAYAIVLLKIISFCSGNLWEVIYALACILLIGIIHNLNTDKFSRHPTHMLLRILRFSFPAIIDEGLMIVVFTLISLLPNLIYDELGYFIHNLAKALRGNCEKVNIQQKIKVPYYKLCMMHMPFQIMILYHLNALIFLSGNILLLIGSIFREVYRKH